MHPLRQSLSDRMLRFAADTSIDTRAMQGRLADLDEREPGYPGTVAALQAARAWEAMILWLAWRLRPRSFLP